MPPLVARLMAASASVLLMPPKSNRLMYVSSRDNTDLFLLRGGRQEGRRGEQVAAQWGPLRLVLVCDNSATSTGIKGRACTTDCLLFGPALRLLPSTQTCPPRDVSKLCRLFCTCATIRCCPHLTSCCSLRLVASCRGTLSCRHNFLPIVVLECFARCSHNLCHSSMARVSLKAGPGSSDMLIDDSTSAASSIASSVLPAGLSGVALGLSAAVAACGTSL